MKSYRYSFFLLTITICLANPLQAHFPWLAMDSDGRALYYFGETLAQRDYKLPDKLAKAEVLHLNRDGQVVPLSLEVVEAEGFIGKRSTDVLEKTTDLASRVTFGIYGGARLDYYAQYCGGPLPKSFDDSSSLTKDSDFVCHAIDTDSGVTLRLVWRGKPLSDVEVKLFCQDGEEEAHKKTNENGEVQFTDKQVEPGLNGVLVGHTVEESGTVNDREYKSASHYLTMTFHDPQDFDASGHLKTSIKTMPNVSQSPKEIAQVITEPNQPKLFGDLPVSITSFGAVRHGDFVYAYGGHTGEAHHYSTEEQSNQLLELNVANPGSSWKLLSESRRLQGLALVAHGNRLIRIGGFEAMNKIDADHDLRSSDEVMAFDLSSKQWSKLPSLPEPRSSHDALVVGDRLFVVGGWTLQGEETTWLETAWSLDLKVPSATWEALPAPKFVRRAVALAHFQDRLYVIGGMNQTGGPTTEVAFFDLKSQTWHEGPSLEGKAMNGFGAAAWPVDSSLIVTTIDGDIQKLSKDASSWKIIGKTHDARFFHRLLPYSNHQLLAIGGANMAKGKFTNVEVISVGATRE